MNKTPEEYFQEQEFQPETVEAEKEVSRAEKAFIEEYLGGENRDILERLGIQAPIQPQVVELRLQAPGAPTQPIAEEAPSLEELAEEGLFEEEALEAVTVEAQKHDRLVEAEALPEAREETIVAEQAEAELSAATAAQIEALDDLDALLTRESEIQLISFFLGAQEFTVPIQAVQEVIRFVEPTKFPEMPEYMAGVINLRGKVTPLVRLDSLLGKQRNEEDRDRFIIVCRRKGLQLGLIVRDMSSMYRASQKDLEWNIESRIGGGVELVSGLMRSGEELVGVISVDRIIQRLLKRSGGADG